ncbi:uncharacterized protein LOC143566198 [Bidens hawaiensis]|uniref:uncharacterized protein LOC143566198 n=1 Tax=Bidens hawaiensis TaxID=980011 RepID=UPI0040494A14
MLGSSPPTTENNTSTNHEVMGKKNKKKNNNMNMSCKRFSDEQIKSLESVFKKENKLEPRKKLEMARELGLHPRQVAIWFQNRRARWKSKQVEQDHNNLKADYDTLNHRFQSLKKEKHDLLHQLSNLCSQLKEPHEGEEEEIKELDSGGNSSGFSGALEQDMAIYSDEDDPIIMIKEELDMNNKQQGADHKELEEISRHENSFDEMGSLFDQSCSNWWDIWSSN